MATNRIGARAKVAICAPEVRCSQHNPLLYKTLLEESVRAIYGAAQCWRSDHAPARYTGKLRGPLQWYAILVMFCIRLSGLAWFAVCVHCRVCCAYCVSNGTREDALASNKSIEGSTPEHFLFRYIILQ